MISWGPGRRGRVVWRAHHSPSPEAAAAFYGALFGWTVDRSDDGSWRAAVGRIPVASFARPPRTGDGNSLATGWLLHISVAAVPETVSRIVARGGEQLKEPALDETWIRAVMADPSGASFAPVRYLDPGDEPPPIVDDPGPNHFCWDELLSDDQATAAAWYTELLGWEVTVREIEPMGPVHLITALPDHVGGIRAARTAKHPRAWIPYVSVPEPTATLELAVEHGATVLTPVTTLVDHGVMALLRDPLGATFGLFRSATAAATS